MRTHYQEVVKLNTQLANMERKYELLISGKSRSAYPVVSLARIEKRFKRLHARLMLITTPITGG